MIQKKINIATVDTKEKSFVVYSQDEICPVCGRYSADGSVCVCCQKEYGTYKPKLAYCEDF